MWLLSVAMLPAGLILVICALAIGAPDGMTPQVQTFLYAFGFLLIGASILINGTLYYFFPHDTDELKVEVRRTMKERQRMKRRREKRRNLKSALQISIPGFQDVKIRPKLEDISDSDDDSSDDGEDDPETKW